MSSNVILALGIMIAASLIAWLSRRLSALAKKNREMSGQFVDVDRMKKDFISHLSHELKAPLASMQETTHLLLERLPGPLTEKQERLLDLNLHSGKRLAQMISNLLDLSRLEAGIVEYDMRNLDLAELLRGVSLELEAQAQEKALSIFKDIQSDPLNVYCDPNRIVQLFSNLIENAIRFSTRGGAVSLHVGSVSAYPERLPAWAKARMRCEEADGFALVAICDSGPGIADSGKQEIFETFYQVRNGNKKVGQSLGVGLAISRAVVEAHRGTIWVEDNPNGGSVFLVLLPLYSPEVEALSKAS